MTHLFHVKPVHALQRRGAQWLFVSCWAGLLAGQSVWADVHKCTTPDGRVIFSDQPCTVGQVVGKTRFGAANPAATATVEPPPPAGKDASAMEREAMRTRMRAAFTPECRALSDRITRYVKQASDQTPDAVVIEDMARFEEKCAVQTSGITQAEMDRKAAERKVQEVQLACQEKRRVIEVRRTARTSLSAQEQQVLNQIEAEVARECR